MPLPRHLDLTLFRDLRTLKFYPNPACALTSERAQFKAQSLMQFYLPAIL